MRGQTKHENIFITSIFKLSNVNVLIDNIRQNYFFFPYRMHHCRIEFISPDTERERERERESPYTKPFFWAKIVVAQ